jgi:hypothetical protein
MGQQAQSLYDGDDDEESTDHRQYLAKYMDVVQSRKVLLNFKQTGIQMAGCLLCCYAV